MSEAWKKFVQERKLIIFWGVVTVAVVSCWLIYPHLIGFASAEQRARHGDQYGGLNTLFTGLAFAALIVTVVLQSAELKETRRELTRQAQALEDQNRHHHRSLELQRLGVKVTADLSLLTYHRGQMLEAQDEELGALKLVDEWNTTIADLQVGINNDRVLRHSDLPRKEELLRNAIVRAEKQKQSHIYWSDRAHEEGERVQNLENDIETNRQAIDDLERTPIAPTVPESQEEMTDRKFFIYATVALGSFFVLGGFMGRILFPLERGVVVVHSDNPGWIEIRRDGEIVSEWRAEDGEIFEWLSDSLSPDPPEAGS